MTYSKEQEAVVPSTWNGSPPATHPEEWIRYNEDNNKKANNKEQMDPTEKQKYLNQYQ